MAKPTHRGVSHSFSVLQNELRYVPLRAIHSLYIITIPNVVILVTYQNILIE
jgi:hypothetical protein